MYSKNKRNGIAVPLLSEGWLCACVRVLHSSIAEVLTTVMSPLGVENIQPTALLHMVINGHC